MDPPYVYNVHAGDYEGFVSAIKGAIENPPEPHILPDMTEVAVIDRVRTWLATDWEDEARKIYGRPGAHNPDWPYVSGRRGGKLTLAEMGFVAYSFKRFCLKA